MICGRGKRNASGMQETHQVLTPVKTTLGGLNYSRFASLGSISERDPEKLVSIWSGELDPIRNLKNGMMGFETIKLSRLDLPVLWTLSRKKVFVY